MSAQYTNLFIYGNYRPGQIYLKLVTGVASAWLDSIPMLVISDHLKTMDLSLKKQTRQIGFQEINIVPNGTINN